MKDNITAAAKEKKKNKIKIKKNKTPSLSTLKPRDD